MIPKLRLVFSFCLLFSVFSLWGQDSYWKQQTQVTKPLPLSLQAKQAPREYQLDGEAFEAALQSSISKGTPLYFPNTRGGYDAFSIQEIQTFSKELSTNYPTIRAYKGKSLNNRGTSVYLAVSPKGLSVTTQPAEGQGYYFIEQQADGATYVLSFKEHMLGEKDFLCKTTGLGAETVSKASAVGLSKKTTWRTYRLAVAASGEYTQYHGGTLEGALAAMNATVTRVNALFGKDLGLQLQLVPQTANVIYTDPETDPFTTDLNNEIQSTLTANIGEANYDIGHLFHRDNNNGNAGFIGAVCQDNKKGSAFSSAQFPEGNTYDIDFVAHEMGHQFGAFHTWSYESEGTGVQVEPGSGSTIMSYAGIVSGENVAANASDYFHAVSILEIAAYLDNYSCETSELTNNEPPQITPLISYQIPVATPFVLEGEATDIDSQQQLTYGWEQGDNGVVNAAVFGPQNPVGAAFRSLEPSSNPKRYFPKLANIRTGTLTTTQPQSSQWETLSSVPRDYTFYLTVRDNEAVGAGVAIAQTKLSIAAGVGPFRVLTPASAQTFLAGDFVEVSWEVARTNGPELNTQRLSAYLSVDGGLSFPILLSSGVLNDGQARFQLPNVNAPQARLMLKAENNPFFGVNTSSFSIVKQPLSVFVPQTDVGICPGGSSQITAQIQYETPLEAPQITLSGLPEGLGYEIVTGVLSGTTQTAQINLTAATNVAPGGYDIALHLSAATQQFSSSLALQIFNTSLAAPILEAPMEGVVDQFSDMSFSWSATEGATQYEFQLSETPDFESISFSSTTPFRMQYVNELKPQTTYYWRVKPMNACGVSGNFSGSKNFSTAPENCLTKTNEMPVTIGSNNPNTVQSTLEFDQALNITNLEVSLDLTHSYLSDLVITLYAPSGTAAVLLANSCTDSENVMATFSQDSPDFECASTPGVSGRVKPLSSLEVFRGESLKGIWRLEVQDVASFDGGSINSFSIKACVAGVPRPDADGDGVYDDGEDQCLNTPPGVPVDTKGCAVYRLSDRNYNIALKSQSCVGLSDGAIEVSAAQTMTYAMTLSTAAGNLVRQANFTQNQSLEGLSAGRYSLCLNATEGDIVYEPQCFEVEIGAPEPLSVQTSLSFSSGSLSISLSGAQQYMVSLNDKVSNVGSQANSTPLQLDLKEGLNTLKISTGLDCQGVYEEQIFYTPKPSIFPNPVKEYVYVQTPSFEQPEMEVRVHQLSGALVSEFQTLASQTPFKINTSGWQPGVYLISIRLDGQTYSYKALKE